MGKLYDTIDDRLAAFVRAQKVFFVATAPLAGEGHLNLSPKGLDCFRVLGPTAVAWLDLTGSGVETIAHLRENGRLVVMFCAFEGPPKIVRLHGRGSVLEPGDAGFDELRPLFPPSDATRSIIRLDVRRISDSCGYGVPVYRFEAERPQYAEWTARKGADGALRYRAENNRKSIDGLPGVRVSDPE